MKTPRLLLKKGHDARIRAGHAWVFSNEIDRVEGPTPAAGDVVEVRRIDGAWLGAALYHPQSLIAARILERDPEAATEGSADLDAAWFRARLEAALARRDQGLGELATAPDAAVRLCHAEADGLPGVVVDRYADVAVVQIACLGMDQRRDALYDAIEALFAPRAIVLRGDSLWRRQEGLAEEVGVTRGALDGPVEITEHGLTFAVHPLSGQKTGWFIDQRDHREVVQRHARGAARALDLCCYDGAFALNALSGGAGHVTAVDTSQSALDRAVENAARNDLHARLSPLRADLFDLVSGGPPQAPGDPDPGAPFDLVVLDPPNMTRSRKAVSRAKRSYRRLNAAALRWLAPGGYLATASCSHHLFEDVFLDLVQQAAADAGRTLRLVYRGFQPPDHPVLLAMPETRYLKFFLVQAD